MSETFLNDSMDDTADENLDRLESQLRRMWQVDRPKATQAWAKKRAALPAATIASRAKRPSHRPILSATR
jgi:hypothetical protein